MNRKEFIALTGMAATSLALPQQLFGRAPKEKLAIGLIGTGLRGQEHLRLLLRRSDVDLVAICDVDERMLQSARDIVGQSGRKMPEIHTGDVYAWKKDRKSTSLNSSH